MPKRSSTKRPRMDDPNLLAKSIIDEIIEETESTDFSEPVQPLASTKNAAAVMLGRLGGLKGGKARAKSLTPERRKAIALKAAQTRWSKNASKGNEG